VTHGAIDGNTRCVVWMRVANDNLATTPLRCFRSAVAEYQVPMHMVGDYGGENVLVADAMFTLRGVDTQAYKCGSSRYNTRIERLWREVRRMVRAPPPTSPVRPSFPPCGRTYLSRIYAAYF
jgi:D-aminopeptidase